MPGIPSTQPNYVPIAPAFHSGPRLGRREWRRSDTSFRADRLTSQQPDSHLRLRVQQAFSARHFREQVMSGPFNNPAQTSSLEEILDLELEAPESRACVFAQVVPPAPPFLSLKEAAVFLSVSLSTLNRLLVRGQLVAIRIGARRKIPAESLSVYLSQNIQPTRHNTVCGPHMSNQILVSKT